MSRTEIIRARINHTLKRKAEKVFHQIGLSPNEAIILFYKQVETQKGLPFDVRIPNEETIKALEDSSRRQRLKSFKSTKELYDDLDI